MSLLVIHGFGFLTAVRENKWARMLTQILAGVLLVAKVRSVLITLKH